MWLVRHGLGELKAGPLGLDQASYVAADCPTPKWERIAQRLLWVLVV
jgi:hypothetical protein